MTFRLPQGPFSGVNVADGLSYCLDDHEFYWAQLRAFWRKYEGMATTLDQLILEQRWQEAELLVHTVKGTGPMLGLNRLAEAAAALDALLKVACETGRAPNDTPAKLEQVRQALIEINRGMKELTDRIEHP